MLCENADEPLQKNYTISFNNLLEAVHWTLGSWKSLGLFELPTQMDKWQFPKPEPRTEVKAIRWQRRFNQARFRQRFSAALQEPECFVAGCRLMVKVKQQTDETNKDDEQQSCWGHTRGLLSWFTPDLSVQSGGEPWFEVWLCVCFFLCFFSDCLVVTEPLVSRLRHSEGVCFTPASHVDVAVDSVETCQRGTHTLKYSHYSLLTVSWAHRSDEKHFWTPLQYVMTD